VRVRPSRWAIRFATTAPVTEPSPTTVISAPIAPGDSPTVRSRNSTCTAYSVDSESTAVVPWNAVARRNGCRRTNRSPSRISRGRFGASGRAGGRSWVRIDVSQAADHRKPSTVVTAASGAPSQPTSWPPTVGPTV
jgi:hypothetical protein